MGFRYWAVRAAAGYTVAGYVRNLTDGRVEVVVEGPAGDTEAFCELLAPGPPFGRVRGVEVLEETPRGEFSAFDVRFS